MSLNYFRITLFMISLVVMYVNFAPDGFPLIRNRRYISYTLPSQCTIDGRIAYTFDEGPTTYTAAVLDALQTVNGKATFHVATNLLTPSTSLLVKRAYDAGHVIGLRYPPQLDPRSQTDNEFVTTLYQESQKIYAVIGVYPMFLRLPYAQWEDRTIFLAQNMDMIPVWYNVDTQDYAITGSGGIDKVIQFVTDALSSGQFKSYISLHRDLYSMYGDASKDAQLFGVATSRGLQMVDLGSCLNTVKKYRITNRNYLQVAMNVTLTRGSTPEETQTVVLQPKSTVDQTTAPTSASMNNAKPTWYVVLAWFGMLLSCM